MERREKRKIFLEHKRKKEIAKKLGLGKKKSKKNKKNDEEKVEDNDNDNNNEDTKKTNNKSTKKSTKKINKSEETGNDDNDDIEMDEKPKKSIKKKDNKKTKDSDDNDNDNETVEIPKKIKKNSKKSSSTDEEDVKKPRSLKINKNSKLIKKEEHYLKDGKTYRKTGRSNGYFDYVHEQERVSKEQEESIGNVKRKVDIKEDDFFVEKKTKSKSKKLAKKDDSNKKKRKSSEIENKTESDAAPEKVVKAPKLESKPKPVVDDSEELEMKNRSGVVEVISDVNTKGKSAKGKKGKATNNGKVLVTQFNPGLWSAKKSDKSNIVKADETTKESDTKTEAKQSIWGSSIIAGWD